MNNLVVFMVASVAGSVIARFIDLQFNRADAYHTARAKKQGELDAQEEHDRRKRMLPPS